MQSRYRFVCVIPFYCPILNLYELIRKVFLVYLVLLHWFRNTATMNVIECLQITLSDNHHIDANTSLYLLLLNILPLL